MVQGLSWAPADGISVTVAGKSERGWHLMEVLAELASLRGRVRLYLQVPSSWQLYSERN